VLHDQSLAAGADREEEEGEGQRRRRRDGTRQWRFCLPPPAGRQSRGVTSFA